MLLAGLGLTISAFPTPTRTAAGAVFADLPPTQIPDQPNAWPQIELEQMPGFYTFPVAVTHAGDGTDRLFVAEKGGTIRILQNGQPLETPFLDISDRVVIADNCGECGLLGLAFPPDYAEQGYFFVHYSSTQDEIGPENDTDPDPSFINDTVIARFRLTGNPNVADPDSEEKILVVHQPYTNHNGGQIAFGPDGYLYIALGDGGHGGDPLNKGQSTNTLLGKILRIAVGESGTYTIPPDNPFAQSPDSRPEIWAYGLRNPWRFSFDRLSGALYIGDVGQNDYEEINFQPADSPGGENYGWRIMEGFHCYEATTCNHNGLIQPIAEERHGDGDCSITGGYVSRRPANASMFGYYFYSDWCSGRIWALHWNGSAWESQELLDTDLRIASFGEDESGNLYVASLGGVHRIVDQAPPPDTQKYYLPSILNQPSTGQ